MKAEVIETEAATLIILWKPGSENFKRVNNEDSALLKSLPPKVAEASRMWKDGKQAREICKALRVPTPKYSSATEYIIRMRMLYSTELFPYRAEQLPALAGRNGK